MRVLFFLITAFAFAPLVAAPQLVVEGKATIYKKPDQLELRVGVVSQEKEAKAALTDNSRKMNQVIEALKKKGIEQDEIETGYFSVRPIYTQPPREIDPNWRRQILAYEVNNTVQVKTSQVDRAGEIIDAVTEVGANTVESIQFTLSDSQRYRQEVIAAAAHNAMSDAEALAVAANKTLGSVVTLSLDNAHLTAPQHTTPQLFYARKGMAESAAPILTGQVSLEASVTIVYEIE